MQGQGICGIFRFTGKGRYGSLAGMSERIASIDILRGLDMAVLTGGAVVLKEALTLSAGGSLPDAVAQQFTHAQWGGSFTCWDLVMPLFIFIVGCSMPFAFTKYRTAGGEGWRRRTMLRVLRRVVLLFLLGMVVQGNLLGCNPEHMSLFCNTLQAIAAGYLIASVLLVWGGVRSQLAGCMACLVLYWAALRFMPYAGHEGGRFLPHDNLAYHVDCLLQGHWQDGTPNTWILTSLSFGVLTLMGVLGGQCIRLMHAGRSAAVLAAAGAASLGAALALECDTPLIKQIFTPTMVLWSGGWCLLLLALFHLLCDTGLRATRFFTPLQAFGTNAILAYVLTEMRGVGGHPFWWGITQPLFGGLASVCGEWGPLVFNALSFLLLWALLECLRRHRIMLRV